MSQLSSYDSLRLIYAGYSDRSFLRKRFVVIQGYFDDSTKSLGREMLFLGGYINTAENWVGHSNAWREILQSGRPIEYFKSTEAHMGKEQFKDWEKSEREAKLESLASTIDDFRPLSFHVSIDVKACRDHLEQGHVPYGLRSPHWWAFHFLVVRLSKVHKELGWAHPVELIFDQQQQIERTAHSLLPMLRDVQNSAFASVLSTPPIFRDDKDIVALQAADMLIWHVQKECAGKRLPRTFKRSVCSKIITSDHGYAHLDGRVLADISSQLKSEASLNEVSKRPRWKKFLTILDNAC